MQNIEYIGSAERSIGTLYLMRIERPSHPDGFIYEVHVDNELLMSSVSPLSERELATRAIAAHPGTGKLRILVGGLGLGYTAEAALHSPRASLVRVVDRMDFVIEWMRKDLLPLAELLTTDERVDLVLNDVYADLLGPPTEQYDLILIDVDHSPAMPLDPASLPFYTVEGQRQAQEHLAPGGIMAVWSAHHNDAFETAMSQAYTTSWVEEVAWDVDHPGDDVSKLHNVLFFGTHS